MCFYRKDIQDPFDFSNSQLLEFLTSFFLRLRALAPPVALGNSNNSSKLISLSQKMKLSLQRSTYVLFRVPEFFSFSYVITLTFYRQRKCRRRGFIYRGRADQISILGPKEEKKQLSRSFPNDAAPNISSFLTFPLQGQGVVSVYQKHSEQNKALLLRLLSLLSPAFSSNLFFLHVLEVLVKFFEEGMLL